MKTQISMVLLASALMMGAGVAMADDDDRNGYHRYAENYSQGDFDRNRDRDAYRNDSDDGYRYHNDYGYGDRDDGNRYQRDMKDREMAPTTPYQPVGASFSLR